MYFFSFSKNHFRSTISVKRLNLDFFRKLGKMLKNLSSTADVIGTLMVNSLPTV